jgi:hypothetical protein
VLEHLGEDDYLEVSVAELKATPVDLMELAVEVARAGALQRRAVGVHADTARHAL